MNAPERQLEPESPRLGSPGPECLYCGSPSAVARAGLQDVLHDRPEKFALARCRNRGCAAMLAAPMPTASERAEIYAHYYTHEPVARAAPIRRLLRWAPWIERCWPLPKRRRELAALSVYFAETPAPGDRGRARALEVGFGAGERLRALADAGWDVTGQDVDPLAGRLVEDRPDIQLILGPLERAGVADESFDLIGMSHVLEHAEDPSALLRECWRLLRPGGRLVVIGPNAYGFGHRVFGKHFLILSDPTHLAIAGPHSTRVLAERIGITVTEAFTTPANADLNVNGSIAALTKRAPAPALVAAARIAISIAAQPIARVTHRVNPTSGNEIVLIAEKARSQRAMKIAP